MSNVYLLAKLDFNFEDYMNKVLLQSRAVLPTLLEDLLSKVPIISVYQT